MRWRIRALATALALAASLGGLPTAAPAHAQTIEVTTTDDTTDCEPRNCSLRGAMIRAHRLGGAHTIVLLAGVYQLSIPPDPRQDWWGLPDNGALDIAGGPITIRGAGPDRTIIDGSRLDRIFDVDFGAQAIIEGLTVRNGDNYRTGGGGGGGIRNRGRLALRNVDLFGNRSADGGGGLSSGQQGIPDASLSLIEVRFLNNEAGWGGGLLIDSGDASLSRVTFAANTARWRGGGIANHGHVDEFDGVTVIHNRAREVGGGIFQAGTLLVSNSTISGNRANDGAAISAVPEAFTSFTAVTITENVARDGSAPVSVTGGRVRFVGTIVAGNRPIDCTISASTAMESSNGIEGRSSCGLRGPGDRGNLDQLGLLPLRDNGGFGPTHGLRRTSPAVDAYAPCVLPRDQRGVTRPQDGDGDGTARCDVGAVERVPGPFDFLFWQVAPGSVPLNQQVRDQLMRHLSQADELAQKDNLKGACAQLDVFAGDVARLAGKGDLDEKLAGDLQEGAKKARAGLKCQ